MGAVGTGVRVLVACGDRFAPGQVRAGGCEFGRVFSPDALRWLAVSAAV